MSYEEEEVHSLGGRSVSAQSLAARSSVGVLDFGSGSPMLTSFDAGGDRFQRNWPGGTLTSDVDLAAQPRPQVRAHRGLSLSLGQGRSSALSDVPEEPQSVRNWSARHWTPSPCGGQYRTPSTDNSLDALQDDVHRSLSARHPAPQVPLLARDRSQPQQHIPQGPHFEQSALQMLQETLPKSMQSLQGWEARSPSSPGVEEVVRRFSAGEDLWIRRSLDESSEAEAPAPPDVSGPRGDAARHETFWQGAPPPPPRPAPTLLGTVASGIEAPTTTAFAAAVPARLPDHPRLAGLEADVLMQREQALERRIMDLEALAESINAAGDHPDEDGVAPWQPGGRNFTQVFMPDPLSDFYINKGKVLQREACLMARFRESTDHKLMGIDWLAGRSREKTAAARVTAEERAWRRLSQFDEIPAD